MKINFDSDDDLTLNETIKIHNMTIDVKAMFYENNKYYQQAFLDEFIYEL